MCTSYNVMFLSYEFQSTRIISQSVMFLSNVFWNTLMNFWIYIKIIRLYLNVSR